MVQNKLLSFYEREFPSRESTRISNITRIPEGWETEIYSFTLEYEEAEKRKIEDLILRIYPGDDALQKSAKEFNVMKKLHEVDFPVPRVLQLELDSSPFGKPFVIMEKIDGQLMLPVFLESSDERRQVLINLFSKIFVDLHTLDWRQFVPDPSPYETEDPYAWINHKLSRMKGAVDHFEKNEFTPVLDWLETRSSDVPCERLSLTHGDYHPNNVILREDGAAFVIDWGATDIADYRSDLAWTLLLTSTYGYPEIREIIFSEYQRIAGYRVEEIEYFEVMAAFRRLFDISVSLSNGAIKRGMRPGAETMMRKNVAHIQRVYALLLDRAGITIPEIERLLSDL